MARPRFAGLLAASGAFAATAAAIAPLAGDAPAVVDVLVVGAGQAGMAAAHRLASLGHRVHILEATDHVGGRTRNYDVSTSGFDSSSDHVVEVGGTWLSWKHTEFLGLCKELSIQVYNASFVDPPGAAGQAVPGSESDDWPWWSWGSDYPKDHTKRLGTTVFHGSNGSFHFRTPAELSAGLGRGLLAELERGGDAVRKAAAAVGDGCWETKSVSAAWRELDGDTTAGALFRTLRSSEARQVLRNCIHNKNAHEPEAVSFLYNSLSFHGCNSGGPDTQYRVRGGTQAVPLAIAKRLAANISLQSQVVAVKGLPGGAALELSSGRVLSARAVILTGPPPAVLGIRFEPPLEGPQAQLLQRMPMGSSMKYAAVYRQGPWWRELGLQGDILASGLPKQFSLPDSGIPLFVQCMDHSPFSRQWGVIVCFVEGRQNLYFTSLAAEKQRALMLSFLRWSFNDSRAETFEPEFIDHNWADQAFARGAYTNYFPPGVLSEPQYWEAYGTMEKVANVYLAGSDYHLGFGNGYIEGAIRSGQRAAGLVHERLRPGAAQPPQPSIVV